MTEHIPRDFIELLLNRIELVDLVDSRVTLRKKTGSNFFACCPFHNEKSASFSVSQTKQFYYCFGCGAHGNAIDFLMQYDRLSFPEAIETLASQAGMEIPRTAAQRPEKKIAQQSLYETLEEAAKFYQNQLRQHAQASRVVEYLKHRGVSGEIAKTFEIGFAPPGWDHILQSAPAHKQQLFDAGMLIKKDDGGFYDRFRDRIMFPIRDRRGRVIGFGGRIIDQGEPKYLNSPETPIFQKGHELYGLFQALQAHRQLARVIVVEGYMDVIALFQNDITYAVATLGTATSSSHLERLFKHTSEIIFCFDGDQAGRSAAWRALQVTLPLMHDGVQVRFMFLPEGEDPDSLVRKEGKELFEQRMQKSLTISDYFFQTLATQTDMMSTDGRARFVKLATDLMKNLPEGIFQQMLMAELAKKVRMDVAQLQPTAESTTRPQQQPAASLRARPPSALRLAMTLLIQQPELAQLIKEPLPSLSIKGFDLFQRLVQQAQTTPELTTGSLLERWRGEEEEKLIAKLALWEHMIPENGIAQEFLGLIKNLHKMAYDQTIENLISKAAHSGLTSEEKQTLSELITNKK
ncbi:MAG: DNA primase [Gammaproteobacteria bacterium]|nr:DNA primase [Gammaproteobacteria bacterium]